MQTVFKSRHHPGGRSQGFVYTKALVRPLGACTAPLMLGATASALQGQPVWGYLVWGFPAALVVAFLWTHFRLSSTSAELHLRPGQAAVQSIKDVVGDRSPSWYPLHNVRETPQYTEISVGWTTYVCRRRDWPQYERLREKARQVFYPERNRYSRPPSFYV